MKRENGVLLFMNTLLRFEPLWVGGSRASLFLSSKYGTFLMWLCSRKSDIENKKAKKLRQNAKIADHFRTPVSNG
ncbi:MAG: hypothetical protein E7662_00490 [Ruminococcaceae bacterium]|nr:hypothetical protein [Oscillospiraceae bacterium]